MSAQDKTKYSKIDLEGGGKCCSCTKTKCCCICCATFILLVIIVIGSFFIYLEVKRASIDIGNAEEWEAKIRNSNTTDIDQILITGLYKMESYDDNFEKYLKAMGVPWFIMPLILASKETIRIKHSEDPETPWNLTTITAMRTTNRSIKFNEASTEPYGRGPMSGEFTKFCTRPVHNIVNCTILEKARDWIISLEMEWTEGGMISTREFVNQHIVTKRFYQRVDEEQATIIDTTSADDTDDFWEDDSFFEEEETVD